MSVNPRTYVTIAPYKRQTTPADNNSFLLYLKRIVLTLIQNTLSDLVDASPQVMENAPLNPRVGMVRYAIGAWATALGAEGLYVYKSTGWTHIV